MLILLVEDHVPFAEALITRLGGLSTKPAITHVLTRDDALAALGEKAWDIIILDLKLPANADSTDPIRDHGHRVLYQALETTPGTPVFILTASDPDHETMELLRVADRIELWGVDEPRSLLTWFPKEKAWEKMLPELEDAANHLSALSKIGINTKNADLGLTSSYELLIRTFARRSHGESVDLASLSGGLSSARVLRAQVRNEQHAIISTTVAKLDSLKDIRKELKAYNDHVRHLPRNIHTPLVDKVLAGAGHSAGLFYALAEVDTISLFGVIKSDPSRAAACIGGISTGVAQWGQAGKQTRVALRDIRRRLLWDESLFPIAKKYALDLAAVEEIEVPIQAACIHADLHGGNVLVGAEGGPVLIDYGEVGPGFAGIDPVTLELSCLFHPDAVALGLRGEIENLIPLWIERGIDKSSSRLGVFFSACRDWADASSGGDKAVLACFYSYLLRQMKFDAVDHSSTIALLNDVVARLKA